MRAEWLGLLSGLAMLIKLIGKKLEKPIGGEVMSPREFIAIWLE